MDKIEILIKRDSAGNPIDLESMSLADSKAFSEILISLIKIVEFEKDLHLKIGVRKSSAVKSIIGPTDHMEIVYKKIEKASKSEVDRDNFYVKHLNKIREKAYQNEDFDITYTKKGNRISIKPLFTNQFKTTRNTQKGKGDFKIKFLNGTLTDCGGIKPNFHISVGESSFTIKCSPEEARMLGGKLYENINVCAWVKEENEKETYKLCDVYDEKEAELFFDLSDFFKLLKNKEGTEPFHFISDKLEDFYDNKDYDGAVKFIKPFIHESSLPVYLRTILVVSKGLKNVMPLTGLLNEVEGYLESKIGKVY
ncbi:hypothetical protein [Croceivirga thetidis]|uniref:Uncharacterized protein n=1 Tax=Croceivirga thetidis TaxID=2721623 RepID=A0ABX1GQP5_9FLAO|nr:hypothetical protein [Croceivirga thetidis]NKI31260.1 hypothetical protein [Croceivirga thetidis]